MDIMNHLGPGRFADVDDLLAFISIYDDERRTRAYRRMIRAEAAVIKNGICVDAGCGLGLFSEEMARLGAQRVYAVEANRSLYELARTRLQRYANVTVIHEDIARFKPREKVDVLVHEFFGQLLYDEDLMALRRLRFTPRLFLPDGARLMAGVCSAKRLVDKNVTLAVLQRLNGVLVSGLFEDRLLSFKVPVLSWTPRRYVTSALCDLHALNGDLLYFGLQVLHRDRMICQSGRCENWSAVWTPRAGDRFRIDFAQAGRGMDVFFAWL
jgi:16S rRNA A1518/A1519 N6-dimethyltransferase RsmA/KsgA/DIM1 with predicted DNA glycosylase/AP lyase activity